MFKRDFTMKNIFCELIPVINYDNYSSTRLTYHLLINELTNNRQFAHQNHVQRFDQQHCSKY